MRSFAASMSAREVHSARVSADIAEDDEVVEDSEPEREEARKKERRKRRRERKERKAKEEQQQRPEVWNNGRAEPTQLSSSNEDNKLEAVDQQQVKEKDQDQDDNEVEEVPNPRIALLQKLAYNYGSRSKTSPAEVRAAYQQTRPFNATASSSKQTIISSKQPLLPAYPVQEKYMRKIKQCPICNEDWANSRKMIKAKWAHMLSCIPPGHGVSLPLPKLKELIVHTLYPPDPQPKTLFESVTSGFIVNAVVAGENSAVVKKKKRKKSIKTAAGIVGTVLDPGDEALKNEIQRKTNVFILEDGDDSFATAGDGGGLGFGEGGLEAGSAIETEYPAPAPTQAFKSSNLAERFEKVTATSASRSLIPAAPIERRSLWEFQGDSSNSDSEIEAGPNTHQLFSSVFPQTHTPPHRRQSHCSANTDQTPSSSGNTTSLTLIFDTLEMYMKTNSRSENSPTPSQKRRSCASAPSDISSCPFSNRRSPTSSPVSIRSISSVRKSQSAKPLRPRLRVNSSPESSEQQQPSDEKIDSYHPISPNCDTSINSERSSSVIVIECCPDFRVDSSSHCVSSTSNSAAQRSPHHADTFAEGLDDHISLAAAAIPSSTPAYPTNHSGQILTSLALLSLKDDKEGYKDIQTSEGEGETPNSWEYDNLENWGREAEVQWNATHLSHNCSPPSSCISILHDEAEEDAERGQSEFEDENTWGDDAVLRWRDDKESDEAEEYESRGVPHATGSSSELASSPDGSEENFNLSVVVEDEEFDESEDSGNELDLSDMPQYHLWDLPRLQAKVKSFGLKVSTNRESLERELEKIWSYLHPPKLKNTPRPFTENKDKSRQKGKAAPSNREPIEVRFNAMLLEDQDVWLRVLRYEPVAFDEISSIARRKEIKDKGWKDKLKKWLDSQSITYFTEEQTGPRKRH